MEYAKDDYLYGTAPYEELYKLHADPFTHERMLTVMAGNAWSAGVRNFKKLYSEYVASLRKAANTIYVGSVTEFQGQPIELNTGSWEANDSGVRNRNGFGDEVACVHPILPCERLVNIDTGVEKLKIAFRKGKQWRSIICDRSLLASSRSIVSLADNGIAVTSETAKYLVQYLHDLENQNYDIITETESVSRLGFIEGAGFSPYVDGLVFDGDANFRSIYGSVKARGDYDKWLDAVRSIREQGIAAKIVLAASFASVLVKPLGCLPFFVHLWGGESGTGKTVALMVAASVWADPELGRYVQTFESTKVGHERLAAFLNNLPLVIDELQLAKDGRGKIQFDVYALAQGVGRLRGTRSGGIEKTPTWANCILTSGESPITNLNSGSGAVNRVIEIECQSADKIIEDGHGVANVIKQHYGHAGRVFVENLLSDGQMEKAKRIYDSAFRALCRSDTTEKQAMAAAIIVTADELAAEWIFGDVKTALSLPEIQKFLQSRAAVSANQRAYAYMCDWVAKNANKLPKSGKSDIGEVWGAISEYGDEVAIISSVFRSACEEQGYSSAALLSYMREQGLIDTRGRAYTKSKRINGVRTECIFMRIAQPDDQDEFDDGDGVQSKIPF